MSLWLLSTRRPSLSAHVWGSGRFSGSARPRGCPRPSPEAQRHPGVPARFHGTVAKEHSRALSRTGHLQIPHGHVSLGWEPSALPPGRTPAPPQHLPFTAPGPLEAHFLPLTSQNEGPGAAPWGSPQSTCHPTPPARRTWGAPRLPLPCHARGSQVPSPLHAPEAPCWAETQQGTSASPTPCIY